MAQAILLPLGYSAKPGDGFNFMWHTDYVSEFENPYYISHLEEHPDKEFSKPVNGYSEFTKNKFRFIFPNDTHYSAPSVLSFEAKEREDMTNQTVFTIDDEETIEVDDGIGVDDPHIRRQQGDWVYIHVADPTHLITPGKYTAHTHTHTHIHTHSFF